MSFDWQAYVELANELITHQRTHTLAEAYCRASVSRSYYGVFGIARAWTRAHGIEVGPPGTHWRVREQYERSLTPDYKKIGAYLHKLWKERKDADYEDSAVVDRRRAATAHRLAERALNRLRSIGAL